MLHCIAFGSIIDAAGLSTLNQMQEAGNVTDGPNNTLPSYKIINGNASTYVTDLQTGLCHDPSGWSPSVADPVNSLPDGPAGPCKPARIGKPAHCHKEVPP